MPLGHAERTGEQSKETDGFKVSENRALARVANEDQLAAQAGELAKRIAPKWPKDCNQAQALEVARIAVAYKLDPFLDELIPYQGKPYITFRGALRIAEEHEQYDGYDHGPVTSSEDAALRQYDDEVIWKCAVYRKDRSRPTVAYGRAGGDYDRNQPVAKQRTADMASERAIRRAHMAAFAPRLPYGDDDGQGLTVGQLRAIHAVDEERGIAPEQRHERLMETYGVESSADLTATQAGSYLDERAVEAAEVVEMMSDEGVRALEAFAESAGLKAVDLMTLSDELHGNRDYRTLTRDQGRELYRHIDRLAKGVKQATLAD